VDAEPVPKTCWAERLDSKQYLTNWTEIVANGNMITSLRLDKNELHVVPPEVFGMTNLIWLDLDFNHLMEFPAGLRNLKKLKMLHVSNNQLAEIPAWINVFKELTELYLGSNWLITLPNELTELTNLKQLSLSCNPLSSVPDAVLKIIPRLESLDLRGCDLTRGMGLNQERALKRELENLSGGKCDITLDMDGGCVIFANEPRERRAAWDEMKDAEKSCFAQKLGSEQQLTNWSFVVSNRDVISVLGLGEKELHTVPFEVFAMTNLTVLNLMINDIKELPAGLKKLNHLTYLNVEFNKISEVPPWINLFSGLTELGLRKNRLKTLPAELSELTALRRLGLAMNPLPGIPPVVLTILPRLEELDLRNCRFIDAMTLEEQNALRRQLLKISDGKCKILITDGD
jgi:Leucine-rich repeat (LRR) protein